MNNNPLDYLVLFNTWIGISNYEYNSKQYEVQQELDAKLDKILQLLEGNNDGV